MNLPARMAWRYLFARRSVNAINLITFVAALGVAIGTAALLIALSVFNGFEALFLGMFNNLNPDARITAAEGKTFTVDRQMLDRIHGVAGVTAIAETVEETARFQYADRQAFGPVKGVDENYPRINGIDSMVEEGRYELGYTAPGVPAGAIVGQNLAGELGIDPLNRINQLTIYVPRPRRRGGGILASGRLPYRARQAVPNGIVRSQETFDNQAVLISIALARDMMGLDSNIVSALEIKLASGFATDATLDRLRETMGEEFTVENRFEQENSILKLMRIEKYVAYAIVSLMMVLISFNLIGALWMIVLDKQRDIVILRSLGMTEGTVRNVFLRVGLLITTIGLLSGFALATIVYLVQTYYGIVGLPGTQFEAYPILFKPLDFVVVSATVLFIGLLASILPARRARQISVVDKLGN